VLRSRSFEMFLDVHCVQFSRHRLTPPLGNYDAGRKTPTTMAGMRKPSGVDQLLLFGPCLRLLIEESAEIRPSSRSRYMVSILV